MSLIQIKSSRGNAGETKRSPAPPSGQKYWRSLDQLADTPEFREWVEREFPSGAAEMLDGNSRRHMLKIMAASFGLAGLAACRRPVEHILPYAKGVEDLIPGAPYYYATVMQLGGAATGLIAETHDGRPTKIEGNPDHPASLGAALAWQQASILSLYDPDRSARFLENGSPSTKSWPEFNAYVKGISVGDGSGLRFLSETVISPTLEMMRGEALKKYPKAKWVEYEAITPENERAGLAMAFGQGLAAVKQYDRAKVIVTLDADFLGLDSTTPHPTKMFSKRRHVASEEDLEKIHRLYAVESQFSITGANADHRLRVKPSEVSSFATALAAQLGALPGTGSITNEKTAKFLAAVVKDLKAAGTEALVVAGPRQPAEVHAMVALINETLRSEAVVYRKSEGGATFDALKALTAEMNSGQVSTLVILEGNPVYTAPADLQFASAMAKVTNTIHVGLEEDETAAAAKWHAPGAHYLETWSDARALDGTVAIQQPMISSMYGGKTPAEMVALIIDYKDKDAHAIVKNYWLAQFQGKEREKEQAWRRALHDGLVASVKPSEPVKVALDARKLAAVLSGAGKAASSGLEVAFVAGASTYDGRFANNAWLQEWPEPMTKVVWGNAALISPAMARAQNLKDGDVVTIARGGYKVDAPVMIQPGHADEAVTLSLGYGRAKCGRVAKDVGFNASLVRTSDAYWFGGGFSMTPTGGKVVLASTQEHGIIGGSSAERMNNRPVYREVSIDEYRKNPKSIEEMNEIPELQSIYPERVYDKGYQWGLAIDLTACTGCNACVIACQAENNIPVVGKYQVTRGREMHWLRMDRYYVGPEDDPRAVEQPVPCMQCENAPCENVCPVAATSHSPEGLNDMAYNRCVGTRYCLNNCPFKVRHFNFLNFHKNMPQIEAMASNPDVTVRMRGVMEKCTYCVQRIQEKKIQAKVEGRRTIKDGEIVTACQQTCPADAIVFGNINDPASRVSKLKKQERNYKMLEEMDLRPRTSYLAKLRNENPELA